MTPHNRHNGSSAFQGLLKIFNLSTSPTTMPVDEEAIADVDEPPDKLAAKTQSPTFVRSPRLPIDRTESLLTKALMGSPDLNGKHFPQVIRGLSTASSNSSRSIASTADLVSDDSNSPTRATTPSPPLPPQYNKLPSPPILNLNKDKKDVLHLQSTTTEAPEKTVEQNLGRKRCISFACGKKSSDNPVGQPATTIDKPATATAPARKSRLTFVCPSRQRSMDTTTKAEPANRPDPLRTHTPPVLHGPKPTKKVVDDKHTDLLDEVTPKQHAPVDPGHQVRKSKAAEKQCFHEFASSHEEDDAWVNETVEHKNKITISDCMKKENAIRKVTAEAEDEAEEEENEAEEDDELVDDIEQEDDFAPSDSDDGNESDNEEGFAESDDESAVGSDDLFWAPTTSTAATSAEHVSHIRPMSTRRASGISIRSVDSIDSDSQAPYTKKHNRRRLPKPARMRPGTPDLPDSTDFVCGTFDEDRPLEDAYLSCLEQRKQSKIVPIPQDIDPSFPTSDPEDKDDEDAEVDLTEDVVGRLEELHHDNGHKSRTQATTRKSPAPSPRRARSPAPKPRVHRSPPPPRRLFGQSPRRLRSPPPATRLRSPPASRRTSVDNTPGGPQPVGITIGRLGQRPNANYTASLPHTPNPYFRQYRSQLTDIPTMASMTPTPDEIEVDEQQDRHVRGAIDIVVGLEKKRQKRKDKFWRQHCRKIAREQAERKPIPGRGVERMRELGLECAERNKGYAPLQPAQVMVSL